MGEFKYKMISEGRTLSGVVAASDINEAAALLRRRDALVIELVDLEPRKARESHVQDRFHLTLRQLERLAQLF